MILGNTIADGVSVYTKGDRIIAVTKDERSYDVLHDARGNFISPGFIDIHVHGGFGCLFQSSVDEALKMAENHAKFGTTSLLGTASAMTTEDEEDFAHYPKGKVTPGGRIVELMRKYPNLCGDMSAGSGCNAITRDPEFGYAFIEEFQDRLYYGTDICDPDNINSPMLKLASFLDDAVLSGKISYEAYYKVSRGNAEKLLNK